MAMSSEPPAGYFSTFSILDPNNTSPEGNPRSQKRNRRVFVCIPCHKRKLKCDKRLPCSRCVASGNADDCVYQPFPSSPKAETTPERETRARTPPRRHPRGVPETAPSSHQGKSQSNGITHWATVAAEFEEATPYVFGVDPQWAPRHRQIKNLKFLFPALSGMNYPFSNSTPYAASKAQIVDSLPSRHIVETLISSYMETIETTHGLLHPLLVQNELDYFWKNRHAVVDGWLAQLLMMLALGAQTTPDYLLDGAGRSKAQWIDLFLDSAQLCLTRSPFMAMPDLTTIRTLCMMIIAQMTELRGCDPNQLTYVMGFTTRMAIALQLHRSTSIFPEISQFEADLRKSLWFTIQLLDLDVAMRAGTSHLYMDCDVEQSNLGYGSPGSWPGEDWSGSYPTADVAFQSKVGQILPLLAEIINTVNSPTKPLMSYDMVLSWDARIREKLREAETCLLANSQFNLESPFKTNTRLQFIKVLVHRTILALHHAHNTKNGQQYTKSRSISLKSAMILLDIQRSWSSPSSACPSDATSSSSHLGRSVHSSPTMIGGSGGGGGGGGSLGGQHHDESVRRSGWLVDLCHDDFAVAMIYVSLSLRRHDPDTLPHKGVPSTDDVLSALRLGMAVVRERACRSVSHFEEFTALSILCSCLRCVESGQPVLPTVMEAGDDIEQVVLVGKHDMIWAEESMGGLMQPEATQPAGFMVLDNDLMGGVFA